MDKTKNNVMLNLFPAYRQAGSYLHKILKQVQDDQCKGYTLLEMVITISILMVFVGAMAGSYIKLVRANATANNNQKIYHVVQTMLDSIGDAVRTGTIDFSCIDVDLLNPDALCITNVGAHTQKVVAFLSESGLVRTVLRFTSEGDLEVAQFARLTQLDTKWTPMSEWQKMNPREFLIQEGFFRVFPLKDPYQSDNAGIDEIQFQPSVSVSIKIYNTLFETTYSSRTYGSRALYPIIKKPEGRIELFPVGRDFNSLNQPLFP